MTEQELSRYSRQTGLDVIGTAGQEALRHTSVLIVGVGGLGSPIALYLAGAGIGRLGLVDDDVVSASNLHRQVLYGDDQVGQSKALCAARRLSALNPHVTVEPHALRLTPENAEVIISRYDIVVDGCDNYATRYLIDDVCGRLGRPYVYGAVSGFEGQVSVFHAGPQPRAYRDLYPDMPPEPASRAIVGMTPGVVGSVMAHEVVKLVCGYAPSLAGSLWCIDLRSLESYRISL